MSSLTAAMKKMLKVYNVCWMCAVKSITGHQKYDSASESLAQLNLLNLKQRREIHSAVAMHKIISSKNPKNLYEEYQAQCPASGTRYAERGNYIIPTHSTSHYKRSCLYRTIHAYNSSPNKCITSSSNTFKTNLQKHYLHQSYSQGAPFLSKNTEGRHFFWNISS